MTNSGVFVLMILTVFHVGLNLPLPCSKGEYQIRQECCLLCPEGTWVYKHCTEIYNTRCLDCDEGTYMNESTGSTQCFQCRTCDAGSGLKVKTACSSTSNAVCEPQERYFCVDLSEDGHCESAQKHRSCDPGHFIQEPGSASEDTVCGPCAEGTFSNGTLSKCRPHTKCERIHKVTAKEGTSNSDAQCRDKSFESLVIGVGVGAVVLVIFILLILAVVFVYKKIKKQRHNYKLNDGSDLPLQHENTTNGSSETSTDPDPDKDQIVVIKESSTNFSETAKASRPAVPEVGPAGV